VLVEKQKDPSEAWELITRMILRSTGVGKPMILKLQPSRADREPMNRIIRDLLDKPAFTDIRTQGGFAVEYPSDSGQKPSGKIEANFKLARKFFIEEFDQGGDEQLANLRRALQFQLSVVLINVKDKLSGPKIFDSLNAGQQKMTVGDLVRNDVFARAGNSPVELVEEQNWRPFVSAFGNPDDGLFDNYFFPFGLIAHPDEKKSDIYQALRQGWAREDLSAIEVIDRLRRFQPDYLMFAIGAVPDGLTKSAAKALVRFHSMDAPGAALPFLMRLSHELRTDQIAIADGIGAAAVLESFLVRRLVCGHLSSGMHLIFKDLWNDASVIGGVNAETVQAVLESHHAYKWPNNEEFADQLRNRPLFGLKITRYLLLELNAEFGADIPGPDAQLEHVLPQTAREGWSAFTEAQQFQMKHRLANLVLLTGSMNSGLGNSSYADKRDHYLNKSGYGMTRRFAEEFSDWTPALLEQRSASLAELCLRRWPYAPSG
jgi:hypothetical protein